MWYLLSVFLFFSIFLQTSHGFDRVLRKNEKGWTFPKDPAYHYYKSTVDVPENLLPVEVGSLPLGKHGVWIFRGDPSSAETKASSINFSSRLDFKAVTVKALVVGDVQLDLIFHKRTDPKSGADEAFSFFGKDKSICESSLSNNKPEGGVMGLTWINYKVQSILSSQMNVAVNVTGSQSFLIIDDITVHFEDHFENFPIHTNSTVEEKVDVGDNKLSCSFSN